MRRVRRSRHRRLSLLYNQPGLVSRVCAVMSRHELLSRLRVSLPAKYKFRRASPQRQNSLTGN